MGIYFSSTPSRAEMGERARQRQRINANRQAAEQERINARRAALEGTSIAGFLAEEAANDPLNQIKSQFEEAFTSYATQTRSSVLTGPDPAFEGDRPSGYAYASQETIDTDNRLHVEHFLKTHPNFHCSEESVAILQQYFEAQGLTVVTSRTIDKAVTRLTELGLLKTAEQAAQPPAAPQASITTADGQVLSGKAAKAWLDACTPDEMKYVMRGQREAVEAVLSGTPIQSAQAAPAQPAQNGQWGFNLDTGAREWKSSYEIEHGPLADPSLYKRWTRASVQQSPFAFRGR